MPLGLHYGTTLSVVLNDYEAIKAALVDKADEFEGRADDAFTEYISTGKDGKIHGIRKENAQKLLGNQIIKKYLKNINSTLENE